MATLSIGAPGLHGDSIELIDFKRYTGTTAFYSNPNDYSLLGMADHVIVHAVVSESTGSSPTLTVVAEDSADGENWAEVNTLISAASISGAPTTLRGAVTFPHGRYVRLKVTLGGTAPTALMTLRATLKDNS